MWCQVHLCGCSWSICVNIPSGYPISCTRELCQFLHNTQHGYENSREATVHFYLCPFSFSFAPPSSSHISHFLSLAYLFLTSLMNFSLFHTFFCSISSIPTSSFHAHPSSLLHHTLLFLLPYSPLPPSLSPFVFHTSFYSYLF